MKRTLSLCVLALALAVGLTGLAAAAEVSQGICLQYDREKKTVTIEEYDIRFSKEFPYGHPTGVQSTYNLAKALIGIPPHEGDVIRLAYKVEGDQKVALRVMNVTKQDLSKK